MKILPVKEMRTFLAYCFVLAAICSPNFLAAQWSGSSLNGNTYRNGNTAIGLNTPTALLHIKAVAQAGVSGGNPGDEGGITGGLPTPLVNLRLQQEESGANYFWDLTASDNLDFSSGISTSNMVSRMSIGSGTLHYKGSNIRVGIGEAEANFGAQNSPNGNAGQFIAFGARSLSGGYQFTGNSSNNGGAAISADNQGNVFIINKSAGGSSTMSAAQAATNTRLFIKNDGNIGIGTNAPTAKLQVNSGNVSISNGKLSIGTNTLANHEQLAVRGGQITTEGIGNGISLNGAFTGSVNDFGTQRYGLFFGNSAAINLSTDQTSNAYNPIVLSSYYGLGFDVAFGKFALCQNGAFVVGTDNSFMESIADIDASDLEYSMYVENGIRSERVRVDVKAKWPDYVFKDNYELPNLIEVEKYVKENHHLPNVPSEEEVKEKGLDLAETDGILLRKIEELTLYTIEQQKQLEALKSQNEALINRLEQLENQ